MKKLVQYFNYKEFVRFYILCSFIFYLTALSVSGQTGPEINVKRGNADRGNGSTHNYTDQNVNTFGSNLSYTIYNLGVQNLNIADVTLTGVNADQFKLIKTATATSVAPGGNTAFTVAFSPTSNSPEQKNAIITIINNDSDEGTYTIILTGKAFIYPPTITASGGIVPLAGEVNADIVINGTNLINTESVFFTGTNATEVPATFIINSNNKITAKVPVNAVTGKITVRNVSGSATSSEVFTFLDTYTWNTSNGSWSDPNSWTPARNTPAITDVLVFDGSVLGKTIPITAALNFTSPQTISQIRVINEANVTFTLIEDKTLYIGANAAGADFSVVANTKLTVTNSVAGADLTIELKQGETGNVVGGITFTGTGTGSTDHRLVVNNGTTKISGLTFASGGTFTAGANFSGSPFGSDYANSVLFETGSTYINQSTVGGSPFGTSASISVVVFENNATYRHEVNTLPDLINRTYGNLSISITNFNQTLTGTGNLTIQRDLILTTPTSSSTPVPVLNLNLVGTIIIGRSITVTRGNLNFNPASAATIKLDGSGVNSKTGTISGGNLATHIINLSANANLIIEKDATINITKSITGPGKVTVNGTVRTTLSSGLVGNGAAFAAPSQIILDSGSTVEYYSPTNPTNQTITDLNYANLIISGNADDSRAGKTVTLPAILKISGQFSPTATNAVYTTSSTIEFNGADQSIPAFPYNNLTVSGTGDKVLNSNILVSGNLNMVVNKLNTDGFNLILLGDIATITGEADGRYVVGNISATRTITAATGSNFGGLGITIGLGTLGSQNLGNTTVNRISGPNASIQVEGTNNEGINRRWEVQPTNQPTAPINVTLSWVMDDDNGKDLTTARVWKTEGDDTRTFYDVSKINQNVAKDRTITVAVSSFSTFTVSDQINPLPVELISFNVAKKGSTAVLTWQTASEKNNQGFSVEISEDARIFKEVGFVKSLNSNSGIVQNYEFTHRALKAGTFYYRLKQIDWSGTTKYFGPKAITFDQVIPALSVYPNPITSNTPALSVLIGNSDPEKADVTITNVLGKVVYSQSIFVDPAQNEIKINLSNQAAGVYIIRVVSPSTGTNQVRVIKQ